MISAKLLNGNIISRDADFSKYIETVSEPGVIKGLVVSATKVGVGMARVSVSRSNGERLYVLVISDSETSISGDGDVYINISQEIIDNGEIANEDGTGIATIEVGTMPSKNALKLATISNGAVTDKRNILKKVSDLEPLISALDERTTTLEEEVGEILDKGAIDHLEESGLVGEKYTLSDTLFMQQSPLSSNCTLEANVGDVDANKQIHIQRMGSGTENNQIQLKLKKVGEPTQNLIVEIRRGVKVDVSSNEAYWYGNEVITSSSIAYGNITTDFAEYTVTFPQSFGATQGELLDIVVRQNSDIVNSTNYYVIACDSTQYSEAYSYVSVNGTTRARSKLMPYCSSVGFAQSLLCKVKTEDYYAFMQELYNDNFSQYISRSSYYTVVPSQLFNYSNIAIFGENISNTSGDPDLRIDKTSIGKLGATVPYIGNITAGENHSIDIYNGWSSSNTINVSKFNIFTYKYKIPSSENVIAGEHLIYEQGESADVEILNYTVSRKGNYKLTYQLNGNNATDVFVNVYVNGIKKGGTSYVGTLPKEHTVDVGDCNPRDIITVIKEGATSALYKCGYVKMYSDYLDSPIARILYPQKINTIGETTQVLIYGKLGDDYITDFDFNLVTSVQTGNITLGNAIGFIQVKYRGITYKIPVYG